MSVLKLWCPLYSGYILENYITYVSILDSFKSQCCMQGLMVRLKRILIL